MIRTVRHTTEGTGPADIALPVAVASALHEPVTRAPEVAPAAPRRAARTRRAAVRG
ncbi:hypothetical protein V2W30_18600 [Streptomyces sp. Q6]|uniref:Uncharacterized protein n=1 Tax=Streptomyces citrinus TaxID=3118173 RepID=A0ACD5AE17_9ACTN